MDSKGKAGQHHWTTRVSSNGQTDLAQSRVILDLPKATNVASYQQYSWVTPMGPLLPTYGLPLFRDQPTVRSVFCSVLGAKDPCYTRPYKSVITSWSLGFRISFHWYKWSILEAEYIDALQSFFITRRNCCWCHTLSPYTGEDVMMLPQLWCSLDITQSPAHRERESQEKQS